MNACCRRKYLVTDFTKGKWEADTIYVDHHAVFANDTLVADCICNEATARLIAAAPEMYQWINDARSVLFDLKRHSQDKNEMKSHASELNSTFKELITTSDLLLVRINNEEDKA